MNYKLTQLVYRTKIRVALTKASNDELHITLEETKKEIERRQKRK